MRLSILAAALVLCSPALSQQAPTILQGAFTASAGPAAYRGKWSARVSTRTPNTAAGSWILLNDRNDIILQGTWSAQKASAAWKGTWRARVLNGRAFSGTWTATDPGAGSNTFAAMLQAAIRGVVSGTWTGGGYGGDWRLVPAP